MATFAPAVASYWNTPPTRGDLIVDLRGMTVVVDPALGERRRAIQLIDHDEVVRFLVSPEAADAARVGPHLATPDAVAAALEAAGERFHDWDHVFYLAAGAREVVAAGAASERVRELTAADAEAFARFQAANSAEDLDEAFVELDHELVLGVVEPAPEGGERIACVSSAYGWDGTELSDIGILTAPCARGRGLARELVTAMARALLATGREPQYRCAVANTASRAVAEASGFTRFGTWRVVTGDDPREGEPPVH